MLGDGSETFTAFAGETRIASGSLAEILPAVKLAADAGAARLLVFNDLTGRQVEFDLRGELPEVIARLCSVEILTTTKPTGRGRPKLGVTAREVTLLPRHWEWLSKQPGGASAALRRLVEDARRTGAETVRQAADAAYGVMSVLAGDLPGFEEAARAFFAKDYTRFEEYAAAWPPDVGDYLRALVRRISVVDDQR